MKTAQKPKKRNESKKFEKWAELILKRICRTLLCRISRTRWLFGFRSSVEKFSPRFLRCVHAIFFNFWLQTAWAAPEMCSQWLYDTINTENACLKSLNFPTHFVSFSRSHYDFFCNIHIFLFLKLTFAEWYLTGTRWRPLDPHVSWCTIRQPEEMTIILFLVDSSASMAQRNYMGCSAIDTAKAIVGDILKVW